jgi:aryl-alcohol dehydrogenase-like predicted oxidoreductase
MEKVTLGSTKLAVSKICFGTMTFAAQADKQTSHNLYSHCREAGINFFDCADVYAAGKTESYLGECIKGDRENIILTSKVGGRMWEGADGAGLGAKHITAACEDSLKRLGTDYLDIYIVHLFDKVTPIEESIAALDKLKKSGKITHLGVSNWAAWQIAKAHGISNLNSLAKFEVLQPMYSLLKRQVEVELLPMAQDANMGVISYNPLGGGVLTGKYGNNLESGAGRISGDIGYSKRYGEPWMLNCATELSKIADEIGCHPATLAVAWVMHNPAITAPIVGARNVEQLNDTLQAAALVLDETIYERLTALTPKVPRATDH